MLRLTLALLLLAAPAWADCIPFKAMKKGIEVQLQDGARWLVKIGAGDVVRMDKTNHTGAYAQYVEAPFGTYPTESTRNGIGVISVYDFAKVPPEPRDGLYWTSNARQTWLSQAGTRDVTIRVKVTATGSAPRTVTISGCDYRAVTLDLAITSDRGTFTLRHACFPELRFGIQTRLTDISGEETRTGITGMRAAP